MIDGECTVVVSRYKLKFASHCVVEVRTHYFLFFYQRCRTLPTIIAEMESEIRLDSLEGQVRSIAYISFSS